jgi:hypothetical protein
MTGRISAKLLLQEVAQERVVSREPMDLVTTPRTVRDTQRGHLPAEPCSANLMRLTASNFWLPVVENSMRCSASTCPGALVGSYRAFDPVDGKLKAQGLVMVTVKQNKLEMPDAAALQEYTKRTATQGPNVMVLSSLRSRLTRWFYEPSSLYFVLSATIHNC